MAQQPSQSWQGFIAFWLVAGLTMLGLGIWVFAAIHNGHRVGALIAFLGISCLVIGFLVYSADRRRAP